MKILCDVLLRVGGFRRANLSGADLSGADLSRANLSRADLSQAYLSGANLSRADLSQAKLSRADLSQAYLSGANLSRADLSGADLSGADLREADLSQAYLSGANLSRADLSEADLSGANLSGAILSRADLWRANLSGTVLDPARTDHSSSEELVALGLSVVDGYVYGYRTRRSQHVGSTVYKPGEYAAPVFSVCRETSCHPGIYLATEEWLDRNDYTKDRVIVRAKVTDTLIAGDKIRTRRLEVLGRV